MEVSQKEQNRSKWRASTKRGRGRGPSSRGGRGPPGLITSNDLDSNYGRYQGSDEEGDTTADDGLPVRLSQGADLEQLLAESEQFYAQAHFRYRSFLEAVDTQPPPVDLAAFDQELVIQPAPLIHALAQLPLNKLLGLAVPSEFLAEGSWDNSPTVDIGKHTQQQSSTPPQQHQAALAGPPAAGAHQARHPPVHQSGAPPQHTTAGHAQAALVSSTVSMPVPPAPALAMQPRPAAAAATRTGPQQAAAAASKPDDDDTDELLELLLAGTPTPPPASAGAASSESVAPPAVSRAAPVSAAPLVAGGGRNPPTGPLSAPLTAAPAAQPAAVQSKPSSAAFDDELDALLGLGASAAGSSKPQQQPQGQVAHSGAGGASKKQSLEEWLDGF